jgi:hypothetical protein
MYKFERKNMEYKIPYVDGLGIDEKDRFILLDSGDNRYTKNDIVKFNSSRNNEEIKLKQYNKDIARTKQSWILLAKHKLYLPKEYEECSLLYDFVASKVKNISTVIDNKYPSYVILFRIPVYLKSSIYKDYRIIPEYPRYAINQSGVVIEIETGKILPVLYKDSDRKDAFPSVRLKNNIDDSFNTRAIHKLLAVTWLENNDWSSQRLINFKDNNKNNYTLSNLEWTSKSEKLNSNGSSFDYIPIKAFDYVNGEISIFDSLADFFRGINLSARGGVVPTMLSNGGFDIISGRYEIRFLKDRRPFLLESKNIIEIIDDLRKKRNSLVYIVLNTKTGEKIRGTAAQLDNSFEVKSKIKSSVVPFEAGKLLRNDWIVIKEEDEDKKIDLSLYSAPKNISKKVKTTHLLSGEIKFHNSISLARNYIIEKTGNHTTKRTVGLQSLKNGMIHGVKIELVNE